jgi:hypothetical protein
MWVILFLLEEGILYFNKYIFSHSLFIQKINNSV